ncbi:Kynurenine-oxoglutarate transaminase [Phytophthora cinnamomi]|uniref:Kynurenine-oxoglutarate transaminase n=1 Tax=Phytophthora cinnamomi TaxID=4785 RepID=UPI0035596FC1|nr:Kynurenine-oxoglutarate transaminase [Phytophthora cinnamomi]
MQAASKLSLALSLPAHAHARGISQRVRSLPPNVFAEFSALAAQHGAVNLGQGFPSFQTPQFVKQAAMDAIADGNNQYTRPGGHVSYVETLAEMYAPLLGRELDPLREVVTFNGAQEGIASIMAALLEPGDEVLTLEPYFDAYVTVSQLHGVRARGAPFRFAPAKRAAFLSQDAHVSERFSSRDFELDLHALERMITPQTKMLVLNSPHNPTGKVLSGEELAQLARVLERHPHVLVLADEVYEFMTYDGLAHERIAALPGFFDRTVSLFSAGKTFSCTGWRAGYAVGPAHLVGGITKAHSTVPFCGTTPIEVALASAFREAKHNGYYDELRETLQAKRDRLCDALQAYNWRPIVPEGGYFVCCNVEGLPFYDEFRGIEITPDTPKTEFPDYQFAYKLAKAGHLAVIPTSPFFSRPENRLAPGVVRLAFCKDDKTLDDSIRVIESLKN